MEHNTSALLIGSTVESKRHQRDLVLGGTLHVGHKTLSFLNATLQFWEGTFNKFGFKLRQFAQAKVLLHAVGSQEDRG